MTNATARPDSATIDLGFLLVTMSEQAVTEMSRAVDRVAARTRADGKVHDVTFGFKEGSGITFHCTDEPVQVAGPRLESYCELRKYKEEAREWFGLCMSSTEPDVTKYAEQVSMHQVVGFIRHITSGIPILNGWCFQDN